MKRIVLLAFVLVLLSTAMVTGLVKPVVAEETIYIKSDGSVEGTDKIQRDGNVYTFTDDIFGSIVVERNNIVVDGAGYTLQGTGSGTGIYLSYRSNVTIKNIEIKAFTSGIELARSLNNIISGNNIEENLYGIYVGDSSNHNRISGNNITSNTNGIDQMESSNYNSISGNNIESNTGGIGLSGCSNNIISENNVIANTAFGIVLSASSNNSVCGNNVTNNGDGIHLTASSNNVLRNNSMDNNKNNFGIAWGYSPSITICVNVVDTSNTVDDKPIYYWINKRDKTVPSDAGYVALVDCTGITVQKLNLAGNSQGVLLVSTENSRITKNNITNNRIGIVLYDSSNNNVRGNNITNNAYGIYFREASNNNIYNNNFVNNEKGVYDVAGAWPAPDVALSINIWNNSYPSGGNYWSDYEARYSNATELDGSGIWDTPYVINEKNQDNYPLMNPIVIPETQQSELSPTWIVTAIVIIAVVGATLLFYFRKIRKTTAKDEKQQDSCRYSCMHAFFTKMVASGPTLSFHFSNIWPEVCARARYKTSSKVKLEDLIKKYKPSSEVKLKDVQKEEAQTA